MELNQVNSIKYKWMRVNNLIVDISITVLIHAARLCFSHSLSEIISKVRLLIKQVML